MDCSVGACVSVKQILEALGKSINYYLWKLQKAFVQETGITPKQILHLLYTFLWKTFFFFKRLERFIDMQFCVYEQTYANLNI